MELVHAGHCVEAQVEPISCFEKKEITATVCLVNDDLQNRTDHNCKWSEITNLSTLHIII